MTDLMHFMPRRSRIGRQVGTFLGLFLAGAPGCGEGTAGPPGRAASHHAPEPAATSAAGPNLLVICVDTLRADRLGCYGYGRATTPALDRLAARGRRYARAYGTAPWTLPSTGSLMTGLKPEVHRAQNFLAPLAPQARLLAQHLSAAGFETAAVVGNYFVQGIFGFDRGFGQYDGDCLVDRTGINSDKISDKAVAWLAAHRESQLAQRGEAPFFLYLHYFDPHYNYYEHSGFTFGSSDTERVWSGEDIFELRENLKHFDAADRARLDALYDGEVAFTDHHIGRVLAELDDLGLSANTFVVVTSDHGEALGEHGWIGHTVQLYEESIRIPLIVAGPGIAAEVRPEIAQIDGVLPTLLDALGLAAAGAAELPGREYPPLAGRPGAPLASGEALASVQTTGMDEPDDVRPKKMVEQPPWRLFIDLGAEGQESYRIFKTDEPKGLRKKDPKDHPDEVARLLELRRVDYEARRKERERHAETATRRRTLVVGDWKLLLDEVTGGVELYDLAHDPHEAHDLLKEPATTPEVAARLRSMKERLAQALASMAAQALPDAEPISGEAAEEQRRRAAASGYTNR